MRKAGLRWVKERTNILSELEFFDLEGNLISTFNNNVELAIYLNISKVTVGKYLNSNLIYNNIYYFRAITG